MNPPDNGQLAELRDDGENVLFRRNRTIGVTWRQACNLHPAGPAFIPVTVRRIRRVGVPVAGRVSRCLLIPRSGDQLKERGTSGYSVNDNQR
ncbi:unnamed protein product [Nesidiocoris tenuis]|uniref:Uncharacterized protein n=1 Tax=Nesidiocoris tenuis TaxID=355587 RepID=A0A6H5GA55_9HEMI|nr:unnamed protein product [Nesidiocoris tenuis]